MLNRLRPIAVRQTKMCQQRHQAQTQLNMKARRSVSTQAQLIEKVERMDGHEKEFLQQVTEVVPTLQPVFNDQPHYLNIMERLTEPERVISFRVPWLDDQGKQHVNRGFRIQFNSQIGPYKGGLRFHPSVNQGILKFLGFEQIFKNSLTTLPMGGGKGGSNFDPKGKSDREVYQFCTSFMTELHRHIGQIRDVPQGDIGVGGREIGYLYGQYKRLSNNGGENGILTGKQIEYGGSLIRPEQTGYGTIYFQKHMLEELGQTDFKGKLCQVSGSGNVQQFQVEKLIEFGQKQTTMSDSRGTIYCKTGITSQQLDQVMNHKNVLRLPLQELDCAKHGFEYVQGKKPWEVAEKVDCQFPCQTENEINGQEQKMLCDKGLKCVQEGQNMPTTNDGIEIYFENNVLYGPGKQQNAGGVQVSGLEMQQNQSFLPWSREEVDNRLKGIMANIFNNCTKTSDLYGYGKTNLQQGQNIQGFLKVQNQMHQQGHY